MNQLLESSQKQSKVKALKGAVSQLISFFSLVLFNFFFFFTLDVFILFPEIDAVFLSF